MEDVGNMECNEPRDVCTMLVCELHVVPLPCRFCLELDEPRSEQESRNYVDQGINITQLFREHWKELHTKEDPTQEWFDDWLARIPKICSKCAVDFAAIIARNPPRFSDWFRWTWEVHNEVNAKLNPPRPQLSLEEAMGIWFQKSQSS
jgi:Erv1 / Alr family